MAGPSAVFVYGTLMPGQQRWPALRPYAVSTQPARAPGSVWDTGLGYPAARFIGGRPGRHVPATAGVPGVLVDIRPDRLEEALALLDAIEGEGALFRRVEICTSGGPAFGYEWLGPTGGMRLLPSGWVE